MRVLRHAQHLARSGTGLSLAQIDELNADYRSNDLLSDRDKAVVRWSEVVTTNEAARGKAAFEALNPWFDDGEIVEITWLCAMFNMLNRVHDSLHLDSNRRTTSPISNAVPSCRKMRSSSGRAIAERMHEHLTETVEQAPPGSAPSL